MTLPTDVGNLSSFSDCRFSYHLNSLRINFGFVICKKTFQGNENWIPAIEVGSRILYFNIG